MKISSEIIDRISKNPSIYLGCRSLTRLQAFLHGYEFASIENGNSLGKNELPDFALWLAEKAGCSRDLGYVEILLFLNGGDDVAAFDSFFEWRALFQKEN